MVPVVPLVLYDLIREEKRGQRDEELSPPHGPRPLESRRNGRMAKSGSLRPEAPLEFGACQP